MKEFSKIHLTLTYNQITASYYHLVPSIYRCL